MKLTLHAADDRLVLVFDDHEEARGFFGTAAAQHGFLIHLEQRLKQFQRIRLDARAEPSWSFSCTAEVVQLFPGPSIGTAFQLRDWDAVAFDRSFEAGAPDTDDETSDGDDMPAGYHKEGEHGRSPLFRIKQLNPNDRFRLATRANRIERQILVRDTSPHVLMGLLSHPQLEDKEVLELVKSTHSSSGIMKRVSDNRKWMMNPEIRFHVVRSPKTPPQDAIKHLEALRTRELGTLAKGASREVLKKAALKVYLKRIGKAP